MAAIKNVVVPDLGGAGDVVVIEVLVKAGSQVKSDTSVVVLESDKATMEVPAGLEGIVKELKVKVGDKVAAGAALVAVEVASDKAESPKAASGAKESTSSANNEKPKQPSAAKTTAPSVSKPKQPISENNAAFSAESNGLQDIHAGPAVRRLAREFGVNLTQVRGSGFKQRIMKEDVQAYVKARLTEPAAQSAQGFMGVAPLPAIDFSQWGKVVVQSLSRIKKISGKNLHRNWVSIPHVTQFAEADITELDAYRQKHKARFEKEGLKLTPLVFIMKAVVECLRKFPHFNASLDPQGENLILKEYFHIGVAVDTPEGLVVPVVRDVNQKRISVLAKELSVLSEKARAKQLLPQDMQGGCFSISSLGGIGGTAFTPIINAPEVAILGVSKVAQKPLYQEGTWVPRLMLPLSLSYDHRVIDGAEAARFIVYLSDLLSDIRHLLL